ncbi:MAG: phosphatase PAP2 family protein [Desulfobacterales bacterium]|nr:phosphatase PAP2 family protein [Desulfobacterales bacterium]
MLFFIIILRNLIKRERPIPYLKNISFLMTWNKYSFPSLHSARMFMLTVIISKNYPNLMLAILTIAIIISFTRIYLEKHFASDVVFGAIVGILSGRTFL